MPKLLWLSIARARIQASVNRWRISVLCHASRQCLAFSSRDALVDGSSRPRLETPHEVPPTLSSPVLGSDGPVDPHSLVSGLPSGSEVVAPRAPPLSGGLPSSGVSRPQLLVRRLGRGLGGHIWAVTPLPASSARQRLRSLSTQESFWWFVEVSSTSSRLWGGRTVTVFCDNVMAVAYLRKERARGLHS